MVKKKLLSLQRLLTIEDEAVDTINNALERIEEYTERIKKAKDTEEAARLVEIQQKLQIGVDNAYEQVLQVRKEIKHFIENC